MAKKPGKASNPKERKPKPKSTTFSFATHNGSWLYRALFAGLGGILTYILLPRLQFNADIKDSIRFFISFVVLLSILWGSSDHFSKNRTWISWSLLIAFMLQLIANLGLQFNWFPSNTFLQLIATSFILPTGALWACLLSTSTITNHQQSETSSFVSTFSKPAVFIPALLVLVIGCFLLFYGLGKFDFYEDEGMVINAAIGLRDQGLSYLTEGYDRAWIHSWLVSQSIQLFGESEWSARLPSAIFGLIFILSAYYISYKWFKWPLLGVFVALICLMTDEFLILFRYTRMYALLIPIFLMGLYLSYVFLIRESTKYIIPNIKSNALKFHAGYGIAALLIMGLAFHIHALAGVGFLGIFFLLLFLWISTRQYRYKILLLLTAGIGMFSYALGLADVEVFRMIPKALKRMMMENSPEYAYYSFLFNNGLPTNVTLMTLFAGIGLFFNKQWELKKKQILGFLYMVIILDFIFMVYLLADEGRDYRYIVHIVPLVVAIELIVLYASGKIFSQKIIVAILISLPLLYSGYTMTREYREVYIRHPWSPLYSKVYPDIQSKYKAGEALFYQNIKTYYLDPEELAGQHAIKMGRRKEYSLDQFKQALEGYTSAWVVFDTHKAYHVDPSIIQFLTKRAQKVHGSAIDETGVEVYYFVL